MTIHQIEWIQFGEEWKRCRVVKCSAQWECDRTMRTQGGFMHPDGEKKVVVEVKENKQ
jgi:hypothetical protein